MSSTETKQDHALGQAKAQLESIVEMIAALHDSDCSETAYETIQEDPLSILVRGDWHAVGSEPDGSVEFEILLCTGGPAVRIVGDLARFNQPENPRLEYQDWFTSWKEYPIESESDREALSEYCQQFYFGD